MLHIIAQKFGRNLKPAFFSGISHLRTSRLALSSVGVGLSAGGAAALAHPATSAVSAVFAALTEQSAARGNASAPLRENDDYWREHHDQQPYASERPYSDYATAYQTGYEGFMKYGENSGSFEAAEPQLRNEYEKRLPAPEWDRPAGTATALAAAKAHLLWDDARHAAKTAWKRAQKQLTPARDQHRRAA